MAGNPQLTVEIGANLTAYNNAINQATQQTRTFDNTVSTLSANISRNIANVNRVNISQFTASLQAGQLSIQRFNNTPLNPRPIVQGANQAAFALTNLGRVAQDAPFGFIGIQNNLNPLLESFQRLRAETGSNGAALKALGSSLIGPAGLGIALSVVTSAITFYTLYQQKARKETKEAEEVNKDYAKSLDAVSRGLLKGAQDASASLVPLQQLYKATQDTSLSINERKKAVDALQEEYPSYFANIKDEAFLAGKASLAYDKLTISIIAKAKASALEDELKDNAKLLRTLEKRGELNIEALKSASLEQDYKTAISNQDKDQLNAVQSKIVANKRLIDIVNKASNNEAYSVSKDEDGNEVIKLKDAFQLSKERLDIQRKLNIAKKTEVDLSTAIYDIIKQNGVDSLINDGGKAAIEVDKIAEIYKELALALKVNDLAFDETFNEKRIKDIDSYQSAIESLVKEGIDPASSSIQKLIDKQNELVSIIRGKDLAPAVSVTDKLGSTETKTPTVKFPKVEGLNVGKNELLEFISSLEDALDKTLELPNQINLISDAISSSFFAMGEAIASGGSALEAGGQVLKSVVSGIMAQLGQQLVVLGTAKVEAGILASPFGGKLVAEGAGLIAIGSALSLAGGAISKAGTSGKKTSKGVDPVRGFATGGYNISGGLAMVGEKGPELVNLPTGADVLNNQKTKRLMSSGNGANINLTGGIGISRDELYVWLQKAGRERDRLGVGR